MKLEYVLGKYYADGVEISAEQYDMLSNTIVDKNLSITISEPEEGLEEKLARLENQILNLTYTINQISNNVIEVIKKNNSDFTLGDYLNPIHYTLGIEVKASLFYTDGDDIWEALKNGIPTGFNDREYFDIID